MKRALILTFCVTLFYVSPASAGNVYSTLIEALQSYKNALANMRANCKLGADRAIKAYSDLENQANDISRKLKALPDTPANKVKRTQLEEELAGIRQRMKAEANSVIYGDPLDLNGTYCRRFAENLAVSSAKAIFDFKKLDWMQRRDAIETVRNLMQTYTPGSTEYQRLLVLLNEMQRLHITL